MGNPERGKICNHTKIITPSALVKASTKSQHLVQFEKAFSIENILKQASFGNIGITGFKPVSFSFPGNHIECPIIIDLDDFPKLVYHIMIFLTMFERKNLLGPWTWAIRAFRLMVNNFVTDPELYHLDLLSGRIAEL